MSTRVPGRIKVRNVEDHVEVVGLNEEAVSYAISLYRAVTDEQVHARATLASHVNQAMLEADIPLVSPESQRQVQRSAALRKRLLEENGAESYESLAQRRGSQASSVRTWVSRVRERGELFTVKVKGHTLIPAVQLTDAGDLNPAVTELVRPLLAAGLDGWSLWAWLTSPTGLLSGESPVEVAETNRGRAHKAAERFAAELRRARPNDS